MGCDDTDESLRIEQGRVKTPCCTSSEKFLALILFEKCATVIGTLFTWRNYAMISRSYLPVAAFVFTSVCLSGFSVRAADVVSKAEAPIKAQQIDDDTQKRLSDTLTKMDELDKNWQQSGKNAAKNSDSMSKEDKKRAEDRRKAAEKEEKENRKAEEKGAKTASRSSGSGERVSYSSGNGGSVEAGGVSRGSSSSSSGGGGSVREGGHSSGSTSTRATVIRLDGPDK
jgi:Skp family chaperone for outer membrane proteins